MLVFPHTALYYSPVIFHCSVKQFMENMAISGNLVDTGSSAIQSLSRVTNRLLEGVAALWVASWLRCGNVLHTTLSCLGPFSTCGFMGGNSHFFILMVTYLLYRLLFCEFCIALYNFGQQIWMTKKYAINIRVRCKLKLRYSMKQWLTLHWFWCMARIC